MSLRERIELPPSPISPQFLDRAQTLTGALEALAAAHPDYACLRILQRREGEVECTLGAVWQRSGEMQAALAACGVGSGSIVVIILPTGPELVAAYFGTMRSGGAPALVATPSNRLSDPTAYLARVSSILENSQTRALITSDEVAAIFRTNRTALPEGTTILTPADVAEGPQPTPDLSHPEGLATVQYSSGATGPPKGVLLSHRAMLNNVRALREGLALTPADVSVNWIPLYHDMGLIDAFLLPLLSGCPTVLIPTMDFMRQPSLWLWAIHHYGGAHVWAPNFAYTLCAKRIPERELEGLDLSCWRIAVSAAEPILASTIEAFTTRFAAYGFRPETFTPVYGMAENVTAATCHPTELAPRIETIDRGVLATDDRALPTEGPGVGAVSAGRVLPRCEIEIRGEDREALSDREVGMIWIRSDCLFSGYHRDPEATAAALVDGWLRTGDRGYLADDYLYFAAREKDLIVIGGEKYTPQDIETAINAVPGVREGCAVAFGVMNEERGTEDVGAVVETKETGEAELAALRDAIRDHVVQTTGLGLRHLLLVPAGGVVKTTSGKLARLATRSLYEAELTAG